MAEGDVIIEGLGPNVPTWSTEKTLAEIKQILQKENMLTSDVSRRVDGLKAGTANSLKVLKETLGEAEATKKATEDLKTISKTQIQEERTSRGIFGNIYKGIQNLVQQEKITEEYERKRHNALIDSLTKKYEMGGKGLDPAAARQKAKRDAALMGTEGANKVTDPFQSIVKGVAGLTVAAEGFNAFLGQGFEDRFNLANEIRQSGLFAGLDSASAGLIGFSETVRNSNFTLGQAAEFVKMFSKAVGVQGVEESLKFANQMAYTRQDLEGNRIAGFMERFGMDFRQVTIMSGEYLDSLRSANMLGKMSNAQMQQGMEDFMAGVTATSNVLKISLEESAKMISQRLNRKDVSAFLALMDPEKRRQTQSALAGVGLEDGSKLGEAIIKRLSMGEEIFRISDDYTSLMETGQGAQVIRLIEELGRRSDAGEDMGQLMKEFMANAATQIIDNNIGNNSLRSLMGQNIGDTQTIVSEIAAFRQLVPDIDKGITELQEPDKNQVLKEDIQRKSVVTIEGLVNTQLPAFSNNLKNFNQTNLNMLQSMEQIGQNLAPAASVITEGAGLLSNSVKTLVASILDGAELLTGGFKSAGDTVGDMFGLSGNNTGILGNTGVGDRAEQADRIGAGEGETKSKQQSDIESLKTGKQLLDDGGISGMLFDSKAENMYDEIMSTLINKDGDVSSQASDLANLIGFGKQAFFEKIDYAGQEQDLLRAIEAIKTTDEFKREGSAEKLTQLLEAIKGLDGTVSKGLFTSEETANRRTNMNTDDKNKLISTMEELIREIRNQ